MNLLGLEMFCLEFLQRALVASFHSQVLVSMRAARIAPVGRTPLSQNSDLVELEYTGMKIYLIVNGARLWLELSIYKT